MEEKAELPEDEWRQKLDAHSSVRDSDWDDLHAAATTWRWHDAAGEVTEDTAWSVDFAEDRDGNWWLIDAALVEDSWHSDCEQ